MDEDKNITFLKFIAESLVDKKDSVKIEKRVDERGVLLTLSVDPNERGKIIGRSGRTRDAIRTLLRAVGRKEDAYVSFRLEEEERDKMNREGGV